MTKTLLLIDDEGPIRATFRRYFSRLGFEVTDAPTIKEAEIAVASRHFQAVILDLGLPDGNGLNWIPNVRKVLPYSALVVITGAGDIGTAVEAMRRGADHFMVKPVRLAELQVFLDKALEVERLRRRDSVNRRIVKAQEPFFGTSKGMTRVKELLRVTSDSACPVLLLGESGTGKSVVARYIHEHGARRDAAFVEVNCSSLKGDLLANELFGHARGAFTSAYEDRQGLLEAACQGTLFLDEISDMDPAVQAQFLTVLEEKRFRRLGETRERSSDFRLIVASNRDLEEEVVSGRFRKDLYFRINVLPVSLPPLRERLMDIPPLVGHLLASLGNADHEVLPETMSCLRRYDWPGNIRELKNVLERAVLLAGGDALAPSHFPGLQAGGRLTERTTRENDLPVDEEARRIRAALEQCRGSVQKAALLLGVSRATLYRRLKAKKIR